MRSIIIIIRQIYVLCMSRTFESTCVMFRNLRGILFWYIIIIQRVIDRESSNGQMRHFVYTGCKKTHNNKVTRTNYSVSPQRKRIVCARNPKRRTGRR